MKLSILHAGGWSNVYLKTSAGSDFTQLHCTSESKDNSNDGANDESDDEQIKCVPVFSDFSSDEEKDSESDSDFDNNGKVSEIEVDEERCSFYIVIFIDWMYCDRWGPKNGGCLPVCLCVCVSVCLYVCVSVYLSVCHERFAKLLVRFQPNLPKWFA